MAKKNRPQVALECTGCGRRNYHTYKNPKNTTERLELKKYCPFEKVTLTHKESK